MRIILQESYMNLGEAGEVVNVKPGYARNFLLPQKIAVSASNANLKIFEDKKHKLEKKKLDIRDKSQKIAEVLEGKSIVVKVKCSEEGKLYGSITARELQAEIAKLGAELDRKQVILSKPIKMIGEYSVLIRLVGKVSINMPVNVESDNPSKLRLNQQIEEEATAREMAKADEALAAETAREDSGDEDKDSATIEEDSSEDDNSSEDS